MDGEVQLQQLLLQPPFLPPGGAGVGVGEPDVDLIEAQDGDLNEEPRPLCAAADAVLPAPSRDPM